MGCTYTKQWDITLGRKLVSQAKELPRISSLNTKGRVWKKRGTQWKLEEAK